MPIDHPENWFLKKHENGEVFGPIRFEQIAAWAAAAQVNSQDMVSTDREVWTKAPMIPELEMDWLIELDRTLLYGPTTAGALIEFLRLGEINRSTRVINCRLGETISLGEAPFFPEPAQRPEAEAIRQIQPPKGGIKLNLQQRIRDLEAALIEKRLQLTVANDTISKLEAKVRDLEQKLRDIRAGKRG
jgi:hypothetical protein